MKRVACPGPDPWIIYGDIRLPARFTTEQLSRYYYSATHSVLQCWKECIFVGFFVNCNHFHITCPTKHLAVSVDVLRHINSKMSLAPERGGGKSLGVTDHYYGRIFLSSSSCRIENGHNFVSRSFFCRRNFQNTESLFGKRDVTSRLFLRRQREKAFDLHNEVTDSAIMIENPIALDY